MSLSVSFVFFSLLVIIEIISVCGVDRRITSNCRNVRSSDKKHFVNICPAPAMTRDEVCDMQDKWVEVIPDPTLDTKEARELQVVWHVPEVEMGDNIKLYKNSNLGFDWPIFEVIPYTTFGYAETNVYETYIDTELKFEHVCLGYYVIYWRKTEMLSSSCLQTNPTWMRFYGFGKMKLWDMFIPGTHDSSAFHTAYQPEDVGLLEHYVFTQEENILEQLVHGARALDLRVGKDKGTYFAHHGLAQLSPFQSVLSNIIHFVEKTHEIVILDFHDFPLGFKTLQDHLEFLNFVFSQLSEYMVSPTLGWHATLKEIWDTRKYIIVSYNDEKAYEERKDMLWPPITQMWGNVQNTTGLYDYLAKVIESPPEGMWSAQAELTATAKHIVTNSLGGLRKMAQDANNLVSKWFRKKWGRMCHIVAMDFIRSSSIVNIAIQWNLRKTYRTLCTVEMKERLEEKKIADEIERQRQQEELERPRKEAEKQRRLAAAEIKKLLKAARELKRKRLAAEREKQTAEEKELGEEKPKEDDKSVDKVSGMKDEREDTEPNKEKPNKEEPNKEEPNEVESNKEEPNKEGPNKEESNKQEPNRQESNKEEPNIEGLNKV